MSKRFAGRAPNIYYGLQKLDLKFQFKTRDSFPGEYTEMI